MAPTQDATDPEPRAEYPDLPKGWSWWTGNRSPTYYTRWFGTDYRMGGPLVGGGPRKEWLGGFEGEMYWDEGSEHHVAIYAILDASGDDPVVDEYATVSGDYASEQEAADAVPGLIASLRDK